MKILSAVLGVALVIVSGFAIHLVREVEAGRQRIADLDGQLQQQQAQLAALSASSGAQPALPLPSRVQAAEQAAAPARPAEIAASAPAITLPDLATLRAQMSSPEALARRRHSTRATMITVNPDVGEALGLAPEEVEKLLDLLAAQQEKSSAVFDSARQNADQASAQQQVSAALEEVRQSNESELQELLGSKYAQWQEYQQTRPAWQQRRDLKAVLDAAGTPMTDAQSRSLIAALAAEERSFRQSSDPVGGFLNRNTPERHQRLLDTAASHLSAQQLESYRQMLERAAAQDRTLLGPIREAAEARSR